MMKKILYTIALLLVGIIAIGILIFLLFVPHIPRLDDLKNLTSTPTTKIYARDGQTMRTLGSREYVSLDRISPYFLDAVIATEDKRFYQHHGIDHIATFRSVYLNVVRLGKGPGGSTITQQLTKNLFFKFERAWKRKILEALAAMAIEDRFSKDEILETYCNLIYFGPYAYGIERASKGYFGKHAAQLELHEAALLAGILNSPGLFDPFNHPDRAKRRQRIVLNRMAAAGMIAPGSIDSIASIPFNLVKKRPGFSNSSHAMDYALQTSRNAIGKEAVNYGGVRIMMTIDPSLQQTAQRVLEAGVTALESRLKPLPEGESTRLEGALVAVEVATGDIRVMVGSRNYSESQFNRAVARNRQPGSSFKPVVYLTALEELNITPATIFQDEPVSIPIDNRRSWEPTNYSNSYRGPMVLKYALMKSVNTIAAQLMGQVGPKNVINTAHRLGLQRKRGEPKLEPHLSLALGSQGVSPLEMATMFASIAHQGTVMEPHLVRRIEERGGELLYERLSPPENRFDPETVSLLIDMMMGVLGPGGTANIIRRHGFTRAAIGKTGTTNDYRDAWFVGATPTLAVAVWVGYDDNRPMQLRSGRGVTGGGGAAPIWADFMIRATAGEPTRDFHYPIGIEQVYAEPTTGIISRDPQIGYIPIALKTADLAQLLEHQIEQQIESPIVADTE